MALLLASASYVQLNDPDAALWAAAYAAPAFVCAVAAASPTGAAPLAAVVAGLIATIAAGATVARAGGGALLAAWPSPRALAAALVSVEEAREVLGVGVALGWVVGGCSGVWQGGALATACVPALLAVAWAGWAWLLRSGVVAGALPTHCGGTGW